MAVSINEMAEELKRRVEWQKTPFPLDDFAYIEMIKRGIKKLYIDTGRASNFNSGMIQTDIWGEVTLNADLPIDEEEYVYICAQINFFNKVATDVNNIVGYTSDALTVTNADKPYANLKDTLEKLESERRINYYKMSRYTMSA